MAPSIRESRGRSLRLPRLSLSPLEALPYCYGIAPDGYGARAVRRSARPAPAEPEAPPRRRRRLQTGCRPYEREVTRADSACRPARGARRHSHRALERLDRATQSPGVAIVRPAENG